MDLRGHRWNWYRLVPMLHSSLLSSLLCMLRLVIDTVGPVSGLYTGTGYYDIKSLIYK